MTLSMIHSHMKFIGFKNVPDFGKVPMLLPSLIAWARCSVKNPIAQQRFDHGKTEKRSSVEWFGTSE